MYAFVNFILIICLVLLPPLLSFVVLQRAIILKMFLRTTQHIEVILLQKRQAIKINPLHCLKLLLGGRRAFTFFYTILMYMYKNILQLAENILIYIYVNIYVISLHGYYISVVSLNWWEV